MNTNYSNNVQGALKLIQINGQQYQLGKDASNTEGGISKLFNTLETYKASTDGAYNAKVVYDELAAIKSAIGADGETSVADRVDAVEDALGEGFSSSATVADAVAASKSVVEKANGETYLTVTEEEGEDGHAIYILGTTGIDSAISSAIAGVVDGAPAAFDTLKEISDWITADTTGAAAILADVANKADKVNNATSGNFAGLDANGNLTDSGSKASDFVAAESGKRLMTDAEGTKLAGIATGAQVNVLESIAIANGAATAGDITLSGKKATINIPSATSHLTNDSNFAVDASYVHTDNNYTTAEKNKLAAISASVSTDTLIITTQAGA